MPIDNVKVRLNNIVSTVVSIFNEKRSVEKYDFSKSAKAMVQEAFDLGKAVGQGKLPEPLPEEAPAKKKKAE